MAKRKRVPPKLGKPPKLPGAQLPQPKLPPGLGRGSQKLPGGTIWGGRPLGF